MPTGFDSTGSFVLTVYKIIAVEVPTFFGFFVIIVLAIGCAISMLINNGDPNAYVGFYDLIKAFWVLLKLTFNNNIEASTDFGIDATSVPPNDYVLFDILHTFFFFFVLIMTALLIAVVSNSYDKFRKDGQSLLLMEKYNIMMYYEGIMLSTTKYREKYTIHNTDAKMPQGWKEYTGEKNVLDHWDIVRNALTSGKLKELQDDTKDPTNDIENKSHEPKSITTAIHSMTRKDMKMMFKMDKHGEVSYGPAPNQLQHEFQVGGNNKNTDRKINPFLGNLSLVRDALNYNYYPIFSSWSIAYKFSYRLFLNHIFSTASS